MRTLAVVANDGAFAAQLCESLETGFRTEWFQSGSDAIAALARQTFALALVDVDVRDTDPFEACRTVGTSRPVIAVATRWDAETCVRALQEGAQDCVRWPVPARELLARINNVLARLEPAVDESGGFRIEMEAMRVHVNGRIQNLTLGEVEVLAVLLDYAPRPLTVVDITERLPESSRVARSTVEARIKALRKKLGGHLVSRGRFGYELAR